jgi:hypothetical protein
LRECRNFFQSASFGCDSLDARGKAVKSIAVTENSPRLNPASSPKKVETILWIRSRFLKIFLLLPLAVVSLAVAWQNSAKYEGKDFYQFWAVGQSLGKPGLDIYDNDTRGRLGKEFLEKAKQSGDTNLVAVAQYRGWLQTYSTPFLYATFRIFSTGNYNLDLRNYRLAMLAALTLAIFIFCRRMNYPWAMAVVILAVLCIWFDPLASDLYVGNVNCLQLGALAIYLLVVTKMRQRFRDFVGGAILGLLLAFKPNLVFVVVVLVAHWIISGDFRRLWLHAFGGMVATALAIFFAAAIFHNFQCWSEWLSALRTLSNKNVISIQNGNCSPVEIIYEQFHINLALPFAIVFALFIIWRLWNRRHALPRAAINESAEVFVLAMGCLLTVIASRLTWFHYYVLTIPAFIFLLQSPGVGIRRTQFALRQMPLILAFIALTPVPGLIVFLNTNCQAALAACAALLLFLALTFQRNIAPMADAAPKPSAGK